MSEMKNDGGPAFPTPVSSLMRDYSREPHRFTHDIKTEGGMSIRDWFAGRALNGMIACAPFKEGTTYTDIAEQAYLWADAMLRARSASPLSGQEEGNG